MHGCNAHRLTRLLTVSTIAAKYCEKNKLMRFHDITVPLSDKIPIYPGDPALAIEPWKRLADGDSANVTYLRLGAHTGTHIDAPAHFIRDGARVDLVPLNSLIGPAQVIEVPDSCNSITAELVAKKIGHGTERVLFKTRNSRLWRDQVSDFQKDFTYLDLEAANHLVKTGIKLVGIDYLSIEIYKSQNHETHLSLLSKGVVILEGLNLADITPGIYELICLPLKIAGGDGDGAPARAVLRET